MTKIMIGLIDSLASNRHQAIDEDQGYFMDHQVCYLALFSWVDNMHEHMTHPDWTWEFQFAWHHAISNVSMTMAKGTNGSSDKILLCSISKKKLNFLRSYHLHKNKDSIDGLAQDCCNSHELTMELLLSCCDPSIYFIKYGHILLCCVFILVLT